ncbi:MAG TPA: Ig-like domain-containing protein, partial [Kofleriaceae bacterium]
MRRFVCLWVATSLILQGCGSPAQITHTPAVVPRAATAATAPARPEAKILAGDPPPTVAIEPTTRASDQLAGVTVEDLPPAETAALLARAEPLPVISGPAPVMRPPSAMPGSSVTVQPIAFVKPTGSSVADRPFARQGAIAPSMISPQILPVGEVAMESEIRVRFQDAMVPLDKLDAHHEQVATITPPVAGSWKWIDSHVAVFTAKAKRLPQATEFTVTVPAGAKSLDGAVLAVPQTGTFTTPPVQLTGVYPPSGVRNDGPILLVFDQAIDPETIFAKLRVTDENKHPLAVSRSTLDTARVAWERNP